MKIFWNFIHLLKKHILITIPLIVILGLIFGYYFDFTKSKILILPFTVLIVYPIMIGLNIKEIFTLSGIKIQLYTFCINFMLIPFIGYFIVKIFFPDNIGLALGLMIIALLPTSGGMTITWTGLGNGNTNAAVKMTVIGLIAGALLAPFYIKFLLSTSIEIPVVKVLSQILLIIFLPLIIGYITRIYLIKKQGIQGFKEKTSPRLSALSNLGLIVLIFIATALKAKSVVTNPSIVLNIIIPLIIFYLFNYIILTLIGKIFLSKEDCIAHIYGSVLRSLGIALAIAVTTFKNFSSDITLMIALAYIIQIQTASLYLKIIDKIFVTKKTTYNILGFKAQLANKKSKKEC
jgi:arsenite transporter